MASGFTNLPTSVVGTLTKGEIPSGIDASKIGSGLVSTAFFDALPVVMATKQPLVSISTDLITKSLVVAGGINAIALGAGATGTTLVVDVLGNIRPLTSTKDSKENIRPLDVNPRDLLKLTPYSYNYIGSTADDVSHGFLAEDMDELIPSVVVHKDGKPYSIQHIELIPPIIELLKQQDKELAELKFELAVMKATAPEQSVCACVPQMPTMSLWQRLKWLITGRA